MDIRFRKTAPAPILCIESQTMSAIREAIDRPWGSSDGATNGTSITTLAPDESEKRSVQPKGEALRAQAVRKAEVAQGKFNLLPTANVPTFEAFASRYENLVSIHKRGRKVEKYYIGMLVDVFGKRRISELTSVDAET
jgi:hypothetical protein